ncbi:MAG: PfkB family carbohydrate kinase [Bacteroidota bacterium]|nr:PfkB family carbohydrate kinase [Bacteroidota bacterium]
MNTLLTVGSVAFDQIETPFGKTDKILGGAGTFISLAASNFNINNNLVSVIGNDFPDKFLNIIEKHNIDISGIEQKKDEKTFFWSGRYHDNMNKRDTLVTELNSLATFEPKVPEHYQNADILMLGNLTPVIQRQVIEQMKKRPKLIVLDTMNFWMDIMLDELHKTISMVDVLTINDEEARQLSGEYFLPLAAKKIMTMGPKFVIIKKGEHGALLFSEDKMFFAPAMPLEKVFDPTGAGDTFAGGFCGFLTKTNDYSFENMKNAIIIGSAIASFTVENFGTEKIQQLSNEELVKRIIEFKNLTDFNLDEKDI